jgi:hypothetical protein
MARKKGGKSKGFQSKGQRPNVSRWVRNAMRRDRKANPSPESIMQASEHRSRVINSPQNAKERELKEKYLRERGVEMRCTDLLKQFESVGLTRAGAIHAIKTDRVSELTEKWRGRKAAKTNKEKANG